LFWVEKEHEIFLILKKNSGTIIIGGIFEGRKRIFFIAWMMDT
jgi:hypothetical protein